MKPETRAAANCRAGAGFSLSEKERTASGKALFLEAAQELEGQDWIPLLEAA